MKRSYKISDMKNIPKDIDKLITARKKDIDLKRNDLNSNLQINEDNKIKNSKFYRTIQSAYNQALNKLNGIQRKKSNIYFFSLFIEKNQYWK